MKTQISARVIEDSVNDNPGLVAADRLTTFVLVYPRFIHSEVMTHRVFSRNASSSRAIPIMKMLKQVWSDPAIPIHWGKNQPGMQADAELPAWRRAIAKFLWKLAGRAMCAPVWFLNKIGLAKQVGNRLLEPWQWIHVVLTATEFSNFFELRDHSAAQPEIRALAERMRHAMQASVPVRLTKDDCEVTSWHLPFVTGAERTAFPIVSLRQMSAARCARVSYLTHDGKAPAPEADFSLFTRLVGANPRHASPVEHQALRGVVGEQSGNFTGFVQYRKILEVEWNQQDVSRLFQPR